MSKVVSKKSDAKRDIVRYLIAIGVLAIMTIASFQMIRSLIHEIRSTEAIVMESAELRSDLHKSKVAARDLLLKLKEIAVPTAELAARQDTKKLQRGLAHAITSLHDRLQSLIDAMITHNASSEVWAFLRSEPYQLEAETHDLILFGNSLLAARTLEDINLNDTPALGMAHMAHSDPNNGIDRMINHLRKNIATAMDRTAFIHDVLGIATLLVLLIEALIIFRPLVQRLRLESGRADHAEDELAYLAHHDALTGLLNRVAFEMRLDDLSKDRQAERDQYAVMLIDLDDFKTINDSLGHAAGDAILKTVADRLLESCRDGDFVGRLGGDEFVLVWKGVTDPGLINQRLENLMQSIDRPVTLSGQIIVPSASIGCALAPRDGASTAEVLKAADTAMYNAKNEGKHTFAVFDKNMNNDIKDLAALSAEIRHALACEEFVLHYQPIFDRNKNLLVGHESLVHWNHPTRGLLSPAAFLDDVSRCGLMVDLTDHVFDRALRQTRQWLDVGKSCGFMSINVSQDYLTLTDLTDRISSALAKHRIEPSSLKIEVVETVMVGTASTVVENALAKLSAVGVGLAFDDFGLSQASLIDLRIMAVDTIKVDRTFVADLEHRPEAIKLLEGVVALARVLGKSVVVEGVETAEQHELVGHCGNVWVQGFITPGLLRRVGQINLRRSISRDTLLQSPAEFEVAFRSSLPKKQLAVWQKGPQQRHD